MPDYQPFPVRCTPAGTVLDGSVIVAGFVDALARAALRYEDAGMLDTPPPPDVLDLLGQLIGVHADLATLTPGRQADEEEAKRVEAKSAEITRRLVAAVAEGEPGWSVWIGEHDRQLAADLLNAADDGDALARKRDAVRVCSDCGHLWTSRHVDVDGRTVCVELLADADGGLAAADCNCKRPALRLVTA